MPKPIPNRLRELRVPHPSWDYFSGGARHPFRPEPEGFEVLDAWWLAEAALLVYVEDPAEVSRRLLSVGFERVRVLERKGIRGVVAIGPDAAWAVFRGTVLTEPRNWLTDARFGLVPHGDRGSVHGGFLEAYGLIAPQLDEALAGVPDSIPLHLAGHSLGAALATLAALDHPRARSVHLFGSPRVGDRDFAERYDHPATWRIENHHDLVCVLPPRIRYRHVGTPVLLDRAGGVHPGRGAELDPMARLRSNVGERLPEMLRAAGDWDLLRGKLLTENAIADHAPVVYAVKLWNAYESSGSSRTPSS